MKTQHGKDWKPEPDSWLQETEPRLRAVVEKLLATGPRQYEPSVTEVAKELVLILDQFTKLNRAGYELRSPGGR